MRNRPALGINYMMGMRLITALLAVLMLAACPAQQPNNDASTDASDATRQTAERREHTLRVLCDPALKAVMDEVEKKAESSTDLDLHISFKERGVLADELEAGEELNYDAFIYGDPKTAQLLADNEVIESATQRIIAGDRLLLVSLEDQEWVTPTLFDIYRLRFQKLAIGSQNTLSGYYADQSIISDGVKPRIEDRLSMPDSADAQIAELHDGSSQMAIILKSRMLQEEGLRTIMLIGEDLHEDVDYFAATAMGKEADPAVLRLLDLLSLDEEIQQLYVGFGLKTRDESRGDTRRKL